MKNLVKILLFLGCLSIGCFADACLDGCDKRVKACILDTNWYLIIIKLVLLMLNWLFVTNIQLSRILASVNSQFLKHMANAISIVLPMLMEVTTIIMMEVVVTIIIILDDIRSYDPNIICVTIIKY